MKILAVFAVITWIFFCSVKAQKIGEKLKAFSGECAKEYNINEKLQEQLLYFAETDTSQNVKCFMKCVVFSIGLFTPDGTYDVNRTKEVLGELATEKFIKLSTKCFAVDDNPDLCDKVYRGRNCIVKGLGLGIKV